MKNFFIKFTIFLVLLLTVGIYYYIALPAINIHSPQLWVFLIYGLIAILVVLPLIKYKITHNVNSKYKKIAITGAYIVISLLVILVIGSILSSTIVNAKKYQQLIDVKESDFLEDINAISFDEIPILDKDSAIKLGSRKMGSLIEMVSQFEVNDLYAQINYKEKPTRVTPLDYGNLFKWLTNRKAGIPAYIAIDMATQNVELIKLNEGIKYSFSEPLNRNVYRHLRFNYPTYIFDNINFEIDDSGIPYWIAPVRNYTIGLFGGIKISKVVLLNAITGELKEYNVNEVPNWVDKVYSADLLLSYYNYYGSLKNGFLNSILGQKGCLKTTNGYNYIALDDDVWVYTGVTSVGGDQSNVGFVLMNQRTSETKYYPISGAEEYSAMASAEGQIQHLGYKATFPLLLNIENEPTYFIALKDNAGLVKSYAMVNIEKYQIVAIGDSITSCKDKYISLLKENGIENIYEEKDKFTELSGIITFKKELTINGNTHVFIKIDNSEKFYAVNVSNNINILNYDVNSLIKINFIENDGYNLINKIIE